jgi:hypothetical protein
MLPNRNSAAIVLSVVVVGGLAACGSNSSRNTVADATNRNAVGVRASYYEYFHDERTGSAQAACALSTKSDQARIASEGKASSCEAALFKNWNVTPGVLSQAAEQKIQENSLKKNVAEVAKYKILVVGNHATVINPELEETDELIYSNGHWLLEKHTSNASETAEGLKKQAKEAEAKNQAAIEAGEARGNENAIKEGTATSTHSEASSGGQSFNGNGGKNLGTITVEKESTLEWTNDGALFQIITSEELPVNSQAHSGSTVLEPGTYQHFQINAIGNWTIKILPK